MLRTYARSATSRRLFASLSPATTSRAIPAPLAARSLFTSTQRNQASPAPQKASPPSGHDKFLSTNNAYYVEEMHRLWKQDPSSVHASWDVYFSGLKNGLRSQDAYQPPPSLMEIPMDAPPVDIAGVGASDQQVDDQLKVRGAPPRLTNLDCY